MSITQDAIARERSPEVEFFRITVGGDSDLEPPIGRNYTNSNVPMLLTPVISTIVERDSSSALVSGDQCKVKSTYGCHPFGSRPTSLECQADEANTVSKTQTVL